MDKCVVVKTAPEISLKSDPVKRKFLATLIKNINTHLTNQRVEKPRYVKYGGRLILYTSDGAKVMESLRTVSGIHSIAQAVSFPAPDLDALTRQALKAAGPFLPSKNSFAVRAKVDAATPYSSKEAEVALGAAIQDLHPGLQVHLDAPHFTLWIEVREKVGYVLLKEQKGLGGFPLGVAGNVALLMKGTKEELVAAVQMMKRGCAIFPVVEEDSSHIPRMLQRLQPYNLNRSLTPTPFRALPALTKKHHLQALVDPSLSVPKANPVYPLPVLYPFSLLPQSILHSLSEEVA